jgi:hypothetical protein
MIIGGIESGAPPIIVHNVNTMIADTKGLLVLTDFGDIGFDFSYDSLPKIYDEA